jgi:hypothetical protein
VLSILLKIGEGTPGVTGYFEVEIENGKLLHSKKVRDEICFLFTSFGPFILLLINYSMDRMEVALWTPLPRCRPLLMVLR